MKGAQVIDQLDGQVSTFICVDIFGFYQNR